MTLPNGIAGISEAIGTLFGTTGPSTTVPGAATWGDNSISKMNTLTQASVSNLLKENVIRPSPGWNAASSALYAGLTPGIPYTLAVIERFVSQATGLPLGTWNSTNEALLALEGIASNKDLQQNWTTIFTDLGVPNASQFATYLSNLNTAINEAGTGNWGALLGDLGLANVAGLATYLNNSYTYGNTANTNFNTLLTGLSQGSATALSTYLSETNANSVAASNNWNTLLATLSQASAASFASWVATAQADAATAKTNFDNLLSGMGLGSIASLIDSLTGTASSASTSSNAVTQIGQIFHREAVTPVNGAVGQVQTGLGNFLTQINLMFTTPNMVLDPNFDTVSMWANATGSQSTSEAHSGTHSWQLVGQG